jgi:hypothetical protein
VISNMNFPAPHAVMGFIALCGGLFAAIVITIVGLFMGNRRLVRWTWRIAAIAGVTYFILLIGFSVASREHLLNRGEEKYFCEIDCHLAYSIPTVRVVDEPDISDKEYIVTVHTRFDEKTISPARDDGPLTPNPRLIRLIDSSGQEYAPASNQELATNAALRPGDSYDANLTFHVPAQARGLKLFITSSGWPEHWLIGDENSPLHTRVYFALYT